MPFEPRADHPTYWKTAGAGQSKAVLIHCALAHSGAWAGVMKAMGESHSMTAFDMPGHGRSDPYLGEDYQGLCARIAASFCDGPTHIIGHSFGATAALRLAADHPEMVSRLSLIEPVFFAAADTQAQRDHTEQMKRFSQFMAAGDTLGAAAFFNGLWGAAPWDALPAAQQTYMAERIHLIAFTRFSLLEDRHDLLAGRLGQITAPVDLIEGADSHPIVNSIMHGLHAQMPHAARTSIEGAGHMSPITHPVQVAAALTDQV